MNLYSDPSAVPEQPNEGDTYFDITTQSYMRYENGKFITLDHTDTSGYINLDDSTCWHSWKEYKGLTDVYEYCIHCDAKRSKT